MRKVIGIGETILDIIFRGDQPSAAVPGGSVFNGIVSLARMGVQVGFISETGNDHVGNIILQFMRENHIPTDHVNVFPDGKSPVSLAFLNEKSDAEYIFYKDYPKQRLDVLFPKLEEDDIVMVGSYYASLRTNQVSKEYPIEPLDAVSTIGAGDNFNAGLIYGLLKYDVRYRDLNNLNEEIWDKVIQCGKDFAAEVCRSFSNSVPVEFARNYTK